jgi:large repetitive protein
MNRRAVLGITGAGATGAVALVVLVLLLFVGRCSLPPFGRSATVTSPRPTASAPVTPLITPTTAPTPTAGPTPTPSPIPTPTPAPTSTPLPPLYITSLPVHTGEVGAAYSPVTLVASGGKPPYTWSTNPGALPPGLSLSSAGVVSGTPTAAGSYTPSFRVDDSVGGAAGFAAPIAINPALTATGSCVNPCSVEQSCQNICGLFGSQAGGTAPFQYQVSAGALPPGTSLNGLSLAGTFTTISATAPFKFVVTITDAFQEQAQITALFNVFPHVTLFPKNPYVGSSRAGTNQSVPFSGGAGALTPTLSGSPPKGLTATISGTNVALSIPAGFVAPAGTYNFTLTLTDQSPCGPAAGTSCASSAAITLQIGP